MDEFEVIASTAVPLSSGRIALRTTSTPSCTTGALLRIDIVLKPIVLSLLCLLLSLMLRRQCACLLSTKRTARRDQTRARKSPSSQLDLCYATR